MMASVDDILTQALADKVIDPAEFSQLRRKIFDDGHISLHEADMIFQLDMQAQSLPEGWSDFFVGVITDFLIRQTMPTGYVDSCLLYTSPSPRDQRGSRMPSSA